MKRVTAFALYLFIGGLLLTPGLIAYERDCGRKLAITDVTAIMLTWPAWLAAGLVVEHDGTACTADTAPKEADHG